MMEQKTAETAGFLWVESFETFVPFEELERERAEVLAVGREDEDVEPVR